MKKKSLHSIKSLSNLQHIIDNAEPGRDYIFINPEIEVACPYEKGKYCKYVEMTFQSAESMLFYRGWDCPGILNCPYLSAWKKWRLRRWKERMEKKQD